MVKLLCQRVDYLHVAERVSKFSLLVRSDAISENTSLEIKITFDDISLASLGNLTLDLRARFVRPDKTVLTKDLISIDLSSKFSFSMKKR